MSKYKKTSLEDLKNSEKITKKSLLNFLHTRFKDFDEKFQEILKNNAIPLMGEFASSPTLLNTYNSSLKKIIKKEVKDKKYKEAILTILAIEYSNLI